MNIFFASSEAEGADTESYDPRTDPGISENYGIEDSARGKAACKRALREAFGLKEGSLPIIGIAAPFEKDNGIELLMPVADMLLEGGFQLAVAGEGDEFCELFFTGLSLRRPGDAGVLICDYREHEREIYAGSDVFLPLDHWRLVGGGHLAAMHYGAIPIVFAPRGDADAASGRGSVSGGGFAFCRYEPSSMFDACMRAFSIYLLEDCWRGLVRCAMSCDSGWAACAEKYMGLYVQVAGMGGAER